MQPNFRLSDVLPLRFANGEQVRQFSKPCLSCGTMLSAQHMIGVARLVNDHIAIAARAQCPSCGARFSVTCMIDEDKRVRRVVLPYWLFNPYLRMLTPPAKDGALRPPRPVSETPRPDFMGAEQPGPLATPALAQDIVRANDVVGSYQGKPIPAWVQVNGKQFSFERIATDMRAGDGEVLIDGYLVYRKQ